MKTELKAKFIYNEEEDSFDLMINTGDGWGLSQRYKCKRCTEDPKAEVANFISWTILAEIKNLQLLGYKVSILP